MTEHEQKYENLAQRIGIKALVNCIQDHALPDPDRMGEYYVQDKHLNNVQLRHWDRAAGRVNYGGPYKFVLDKQPPFCGEFAHLTLAERVCVLKHVAIFHYATIGKVGA